MIPIFYITVILAWFPSGHSVLGIEEKTGTIQISEVGWHMFDTTGKWVRESGLDLVPLDITLEGCWDYNPDLKVGLGRGVFFGIFDTGSLKVFLKGTENLKHARICFKDPKTRKVAYDEFVSPQSLGSSYVGLFPGALVNLSLSCTSDHSPLILAALTSSNTFVGTVTFPLGETDKLTTTLYPLGANMASAYGTCLAQYYDQAGGVGGELQYDTRDGLWFVADLTGAPYCFTGPCAGKWPSFRFKTRPGSVRYLVRPKAI